MATVDIIIAVDGETPGNPNEAVVLEYGDTNNLTTLSLDDNSGITSYSWSLLDQPPGTSCTLTNPTTATPTFTPDDGYSGTYLIQCIVNGGEAIGRNGLAFTTQYNALRKPAAGETDEFDPNDGWAIAINEAIDVADLAVGTTLWVRGGTVLSPNTSGDTISVGDGVVGAPGVAFETANTGFYAPSSTAVSVTLGGTRYVNFSQSGPYFYDSGSVAAVNLQRTDSLAGTPSSIGRLSCFGQNLDPATIVYGFIDHYVNDDGTGTEESEFRFSSQVGGSGVTGAYIGGYGVRTVDGTYTDPSISFMGSTNSGFYESAANTIGFATNGFESATLTSQTLTKYSSGVDGYYNMHRTDNHGSTAALGNFRVRGKDAGGSTDVTYARLQGYCDDATIGAPYGSFLIGTTQNNVFATRVVIDDGLKVLDASDETAPPYSFITDTTTGFYNDADGIVGFSSNGVESVIMGLGTMSVYRNSAIPSFYLRRTDTHGVTRIADFYFRGMNATPTAVDYARISTTVISDAAGSEDSQLDINVQDDGTLYNTVSLGSGSLTLRRPDGNILFTLSRADQLDVPSDVSYIQTYGKNNADQTTIYSQIYTYANTVTDGSEGGEIRFSTIDAGSSATRLIARGSGIRVLETTSTTTPSIAGIADTNTGIYFPAGDQLGITCGGSAVATFDSGGINIPDGTAASPGLGFFGTENSGLYESAGSIGFTCSGVTAGLVAAAGHYVYRDGGQATLFLRRFDDLAGGDTVSQISAQGEDSVSGLVTYGTLVCEVTDDTSTSKDSEWRFSSYLADSSTTGAYIGGYGVRTVDGATASPGHSFISEDTSGMYLSGSGQLSFSCDGVRSTRMIQGGFYTYHTGAAVAVYTLRLDDLTAAATIGTFSSFGENSTSEQLQFGKMDCYVSDHLDGQEDSEWRFSSYVNSSLVAGAYIGGYGVRVLDGTNTVPSVSFMGSTTTGLYEYTTNAIGFTCNGTARAFIDGNGLTFVGLGSTNGDISFSNRSSDPSAPAEGEMWYEGNTENRPKWYNGSTTQVVASVGDIETQSTNYTCVVDDDYMIIASGASTVITLPENAKAGTKFLVKRVDASNSISVSRSGSDTIDGGTSITLSANYDMVEVVSDGSNYHIIGRIGT